MSPALHRAVKKGLRTVVQLVVGGALTAAVNQFADGLEPNVKVYVLAGWTVLIAVLQNGLEAKGSIPVLLPTVGIVPSTGKLLGRAVGTVDTTVEAVGGAVGDVSGVVEGVRGELIGEVEGIFGETDLGDIDDGA